jgi:hypothetical protein
MGNVLLVDADSTIPNLALMKLSTFHKNKGDSVDLLQLNIPYYPQKKRVHHTLSDNYDKVYCSMIFNGTKEWVHGDHVDFGGSGYSLQKELPMEVEGCELDYSIYPNNETSYGFISRGCSRNCSFCVVREKEGYIRQVNSVDDIVQPEHKVTKFMDNNILALPNHKEILQELVDKKIKCQFNQGLDIRLIDEENSDLLRQVRYYGNYTFAFDDWKLFPRIERGLGIMTWRPTFKFKFFVYCNPEMELSNIIRRITYLRENECLPYLMRDISCWESKYSKFYIDLSAWCNMPSVFIKQPFPEFLITYYGRNGRNGLPMYNQDRAKLRIESHTKLWESNQ